MESSKLLSFDSPARPGGAYRNCAVPVSTAVPNYGQFPSCSSVSHTQDSGTHESPRIKNPHFVSSFNILDINKHSFSQDVRATSSYNNHYVPTASSYMGARDEAISHTVHHQRYSQPNHMAFTSSGSTGVPSPNNTSSGEDDYCNYSAMNDVHFYDQRTFMQQLEQGSFSPKEPNVKDGSNPLAFASQTYENSFNHTDRYDKCTPNKPAPTSSNSSHISGYSHERDTSNNDPSNQQAQSMSKQSQSDDVLQRYPKLPSQSEVSITDLASDGYLGAVSIKDLADMKVKILNKRLSGVSKGEAQVLKQFRRTLKNREYARICREKRVKERDRIKQENFRLRNQIEQLKNEYHVMLKERDSYRWRYEQLIRASGEQSNFRCEKLCTSQVTS